MRRGIAIRLTAVAIGLLFGVMVAEAVARLVLTDYFICEDQLGWVFEPEQSGFRINRRFEYAVPARINSAGFHDVEHDIAKPAGKVRFVLLGDSMLAGMQVPLDNVFARRLANRLNAEDGDGRFEIVNCATDGYGTAQAWLMFKERCGQYDPDFVVLGLYYYNDFLDNYHAGGSTNHPLAYRCGRPYFTTGNKGLAPIVGVEERAAPSLGEHVDRVLRFSYLYQVLNPYYDKGLGRAFRNKEVYRVEYPADVSKAWEITKQLLLEVDAAVRAQEAKLVVMLIPSRWEIYRGWGAEDWGSVESLDLDRPNTLLREFLDDNGIAHFDLRPAFNASVNNGTEPLFFRHDPHWTRSGNDLAAAAFATWFRDNHHSSR